MCDSSDEFATSLSALRVIPPPEPYESTSARKAHAPPDLNFDANGDWVPFPAFDETREDNDFFRFESSDVDQPRSRASTEKSREPENVKRKSRKYTTTGKYEEAERVKSPRPPKGPESRSRSSSRQRHAETHQFSRQGSGNKKQGETAKKRGSKKDKTTGENRSRDSKDSRSQSAVRSRSASRSRPSGTCSTGKKVKSHNRSQSVSMIASNLVEDSPRQHTVNKALSSKKMGKDSCSVSIAANSTSSSSTESRKSQLEIIIDTARASTDEKESMNSASNRKGRGIMEKLFGDSVDPSARSKFTCVSPRNSKNGGGGENCALNLNEVHSRTLITPAVYHNPTTDLWIATVNTNQQGLDGTNKENAPKYLKAFSFRTEQEARAAAYANAPPRMIPFASSSECKLCKGKFALFRRPKHCRNCGICICTSCCTSWSSKMIPDTYNIKNEKVVKACRSCDTLSKEFRKALVEGAYSRAVEFYLTGNINLRCPFVFQGEELMFPIHCAAEGSSEKLLRWLVDVQFCPINLINTGNKAKSGKVVNSPLLSSKGRSIMSIGMSRKNIGIMRYLVNEKNVSVHDEVTDLNLCLGALEAVIKGFPEITNTTDSQTSSVKKQSLAVPVSEVKMRQVSQGDINAISVNYDANPRSQDETSANGSDEKEIFFDGADDESVMTTVPDMCIICETKTIDCVITPCGHQVCCLDCSQYLGACPICNGEAQFIKIFQP